VDECGQRSGEPAPVLHLRQPRRDPVHSPLQLRQGVDELGWEWLEVDAPSRATRAHNTSSGSATPAVRAGESSSRPATSRRGSSGIFPIAPSSPLR